MGAPQELLDNLEHAKHQILSSATDLLTQEEMEKLRPVLEEADSETLIGLIKQWYGDLYRHYPVPVREWVESPEYMNLRGQIFPKLLDDFEELFSGKYDEAVLHGSIGWGKSFMAGLSLTRMVYEVSCLTNPQVTYGLAEGSQIVFLNVATNFTTAKEVVFEYVKNFVERSPYFEKFYPLDKHLEKELRFPDNIRIAPVASTQSGLLGQNMFGGVLDEANFMFKSGRSSRTRGLNEEYDHASVLHNAMMRRIKSRFMQQGKLPGILLIVSSALYPDDFTEKRIQQAREEDDSRVFHRRYSQWDPKPRHFYSGERFTLSLGNAVTRPRVLLTPDHKEFDPELDDVEKLKAAGIDLLSVPVEYRGDFVRDIDMAIRDVAGFPTLATYPFFRDPAKIKDAVDRGLERGLRHPYSNATVTMMDDDMWDRSALSMDLAALPHFAHVDLAINGDAAGIAVVRLDGIEERPTVEYTSEGDEVTTTEYVPKLTAVLTLQVKAPPGGEIDVRKIRRLMLTLIEWGFYLHTVSYDQYQSAESIQQLQQQNVNAIKLSVDRGLEAYNALKEAIYEDRLDLYPHPPLQRELAQLERDLKRDKVDHPPKGSKDVADGLAGATYNATVFVRDNPSYVVSGVTYEEKSREQPLNAVIIDDEDPWFDEWGWLFDHNRGSEDEDEAQHHS